MEPAVGVGRLAAERRRGAPRRAEETLAQHLNQVCWGRGRCTVAPPRIEPRRVSSPSAREVTAMVSFHRTEPQRWVRRSTRSGRAQPPRAGPIRRPLLRDLNRRRGPAIFEIPADAPEPSAAAAAGRARNTHASVPPHLKRGSRKRCRRSPSQWCRRRRAARSTSSRQPSIAAEPRGARPDGAPEPRGSRDKGDRRTSTRRLSSRRPARPAACVSESHDLPTAPAPARARAFGLRAPPGRAANRPCARRPLRRASQAARQAAAKTGGVTTGRAGGTRSRWGPRSDRDAARRGARRVGALDAAARQQLAGMLPGPAVRRTAAPPAAAAAAAAAAAI